MEGQSGGNMDPLETDWLPVPPDKLYKRRMSI